MIKDKMIFVLAASILIACEQQGPPENCDIMKQGTFRYLDDIGDPSAFFVIENGRHIEYHGNGVYQIQSDLKWTDDCEYETEMVETNYASFPFKKGDKMRIRINRIQGDTVYYGATVNERWTWNGKVIRVAN